MYGCSFINIAEYLNDKFRARRPVLDFQQEHFFLFVQTKKRWLRKIGFELIGVTKEKLHFC
jgi:hypothetical protein